MSPERTMLGIFDSIAKSSPNQKKYDALMDSSDVCLLIVSCLLIVITVTGNALVILSVLTTRKLRTVTNYFVTNLAIADILLGILVMPIAVAVQILGSWKFDWHLCEIWVSLDIFLCTSSILSLCAISIDRYLAITQPLKYSWRWRSKHLALQIIVFVWVIAFAIASPSPFLSWYDQGRRSLEQCRYNQNITYVIFSAFASFVLPMSVMIFIYVRISFLVTSNNRQITEIVQKKTINCEEIELKHKVDTHNKEPYRSLHCASSSRHSHPCLKNLTVPNQTLDDISNNAQNQPKLRRVYPARRRNKAIHTLSIVAGAFIGCWLPFFIFYILAPFFGPEELPNIHLIRYLTWLGWCNSAINPFIYAFYSADFRAALWRLTFRRFGKKSRRNRPTRNTLSI